MPYRIGNIAPFDETTPPSHYGGTERVVSDRVRRLALRGHHVVLYAAGGSLAPDGVELVTCTDGPIRLTPIASDPEKRMRAAEVALERAVRDIAGRQQELDVVINDFGPQALALRRKYGISVPFISVLHGPIVPQDAEAYRQFPDDPLVCISDSQRRDAERAGLHVVARVYNGIDLKRHTYPLPADQDPLGGLPFQPPDRYATAMGVHTPNKGTGDAICIARAVGIPLLIAGKIDPTNTQYYDQQIRPYLGDDVIDIGEATD
ncbi:MAG TPA: glycosyltransferase, partial [Candidatus Saccharimonadales bacterium]|nr:glycosyltransferase [Candidatus Saccharimonadales bacterium]